MANVLKYLTGVLSKRAKRRGNLAVGIGEENYGPSSTTGYYAGVTPPENGFVVYATGSNSNPKVFVAETEDDLPAIARTLGGGVLDVLGAKNYIAGLTHAWVINSVPNNTITDGLVFDLNAQNKSSFIDNEPTTNLATLDLSNTSVWYNEQASTTTKELQSGTLFGYPVYRIQSKPGSIWITPTAFNGYDKANGPITVSVYARNLGTTATLSTYLSGDFSTDSLGASNYKNVPTDGVWRKYSWTRTAADMNTTNQLEFRTSGTNIQISCPQVEHTLSPTGIVEGTRSQTSLWKDLSGNGNNGTLANGASYDSGSNSIIFDGTDDEVTVPDNNTLDLTTDMSFEFLFKADSSQNNPYPRLIDKSSYLVHIIQTPPFGIYQNVNTSAGLRQTGTTSNTIQADKWNHVISNYDGQIGKIYINGELVRTRDFGSVLACTTNGTTLTIGGDTGTSRQFNGKIAKTRVYNKALSESEAYQNYYGGPIVTDGLVWAVDGGHLVSYESGSGTTFALTGSRDGTLTNGVSFASENGGTFDFDGIDDYITFGSSDLILSDTYFTMECWMKSTGNETQTGNYGGFIGTRVGRNAMLCKYSSTNRAGFLWDTTADGNLNLGGTTNVFDEKWHHIVGTFDNGLGKLYVDGVLENSATSTAPIDLNSAAFGMGADPNNLTRVFNGKVSIGRVYNKTLSDSEVLQNYNAQKARFGK